MISILKKNPFCILVPAVLFSGVPAAGAEEVTIFSLWGDSRVFPTEFYPEAETLTREEVFIAGLKARFPSRIHEREPVLDPGPQREPRIESLTPGIDYLRIYNLETALETLEASFSASALVLDLRNVQAGREAALAFGSLLLANESAALSRVDFSGGDADTETFAIEPAGTRRALQPVFVLVNHNTGGALEALLEELKEKGQIISIGIPTAGKTGSFRRISAEPPLYALGGEWRTASETSLLESGFVPAVAMNVSPEEDAAAYRSFENGASLATLIDIEGGETQAASPDGGMSPSLDDLIEDPPESDETEPGREVDKTLQRAYHIAIALKSLGKIAPSESR